jgi:hypothetical protein
MSADPSIEERVAELERVTKNLASSNETIKRSQRETRKQVRHLAEIVEGLPGVLKKQMDDQTIDLKQSTATAIAQSETRNADRITGLARQWPAGAIVLATITATVIAAVVVDLILRATGHHVS